MQSLRTDPQGASKVTQTLSPSPENDLARLATSTLARSATPGPAVIHHTSSRVFAVATTIGLVHVLDDAVLHRQPGVPVTQHLLGLTLVLIFAAGTIAVFSRLRTGLQAGMALVVGGAALANGALHVFHVARFGLGQLSGSDATGLFAAGAGAALLMMAAALPFLRRGERQTNRLRCWTTRLLATGGVVVLVLYVVIPIGVAIGQTHGFREPIDEPPPGFETVRFLSSDGLQLHGWYAPSKTAPQWSW